MRKRIISLVLAFCIVVSLLVIPASAASTRTISGVWVFHAVAIGNINKSLTENISFVCNGKTYSSIVFVQGQYMGYADASGNVTKVFWSDAGDTVWLSSEYKTIDFGSTDQDVSSFFYTFLINVATQQAAECTHTNTEIRNATDYYTGDTYCSDCDELIASGGYLPLVTIYDGEDSILYDPIPAYVGSTLTVTSTGFTLTDPSGNTESYPCAPGVDDVEYLGLAVSAGSSAADYPVGSTLTITDDMSFYVVLDEPSLVVLNVYDEIGEEFWPNLTVESGSTLTITDTGFEITDTSGTITSYPCAPGIDNVEYLGLSFSAGSTDPYYAVGDSFTVNSSLDLYCCIVGVSYPVYIYTQFNTLKFKLDCIGPSELFINSDGLYLVRSDGSTVTYAYDFALADEQALGLTDSRNTEYGVDYAVGSSIVLFDTSTYYLTTAFSYPVVLNFNNGVDMTTFTGYKNCFVRVNDTSIDFISNDGTTETFDIPMDVNGDYFFGLAFSPNQITVKYPVGSIINVYSLSEFYIVRQSDIKRLTAEEVTTEGDSDASFDPDDVRSLKNVISKLLDFFKSDFSISDFFGVLNDETQYAWFSEETAGQLDTTVTAVTFGLDEESDYEKYGMDTYYDHIAQVFAGKGE